MTLLGYTLHELVRLQLELEAEERSRGSVYRHAEGEEVFGDLGEPAAARRFETYVGLEPFRTGTEPVAELDGVVVARAWSVRESERAAECAVETLEAYRRHGYGRRVTAAWIDRVLAAGKVPFYSHAAENEASRALAASLRLTHVFTVLSFE